MKKLLSALLAVSIVFGAGSAVFDSANYSSMQTYASSEYKEGTYGYLTYVNYGDYIEISDCNVSATSVEIPSEIDGVPVTSIGDDAFQYCSDLTSITIPNSITSIGNSAFLRCNSLTSITIPNSVTNIGDYTFMYCSALTSLKIPDSVTSIGNGALYGCSGLTSVAISNSVTSIGCETFEYCTNLTSVTIPDSVTSIGYTAFRCCENLKSVTIPDSVINIGDSAFVFCYSLTSVIIENPNCEIYDSSMTIGTDYAFTKPYFSGTIYGYENSTAQAYAEKYDYKFAVIGSDPELPKTELGDIDGDGAVNSSDASLVLREYALIATGEAPTFSEAQNTAADVNGDNAVDSSDASVILAYYAYTSTGGTGDISEFMNK